MVAGFKSKATRKHTYTKVKQKQKNNLKYVNMKRLVKDPVLKKNWDNKKSLKQNLESIPMTSYADQLPEKIESTTELRLVCCLSVYVKNNFSSLDSTELNSLSCQS
eukprot:GHVR01152341.1.p1 GENE.GHVR01152341.1~~GHVR01152341.1.p1  ORF type:complete len:106 (+),score=3.69 GHVR01152341.1:51-368(+)